MQPVHSKLPLQTALNIRIIPPNVSCLVKSALGVLLLCLSLDTASRIVGRPLARQPGAAQAVSTTVAALLVTRLVTHLRHTVQHHSYGISSLRHRWVVMLSMWTKSQDWSNMSSRSGFGSDT